MKNVFLALVILPFMSNAFAQNCQNDTIPPTIECIFGLAADTCGVGQVTISAKEFILSSRDDCTDSTNLNFSFTLDPIDTIAFFSSSSDSISIWVTDEAGNKSLCNSSLNIVSDSCLCDPNFEVTANIEPSCGGVIGGAITLDFINSQNFSDYTYRWSTGATNTNGIRQLAAGTYSVTVTNRLGCSYTQEFIIPHAIQLEKFAFPSCNNDGKAIVTAIGNASVYDFIWSTGERGDGLIDLSPGIYEVTVNGGGCTRVDSLEIESTINIDIVVDYDCDGKGNITITPQNNTGELFYTWENGDTGALLSDLEAGTYQVTITDGNGCVLVEEIRVENYFTLQTRDQVITRDNCGGTGNIYGPYVVGGERPYSYQWLNSSREIVSDSLNVIEALPGVYIFSATDANGCTVDTTILLEVAPAFEVEIEVMQNCEEGTFDLTAFIFENGELQEDLSDYSFRWSGASRRDTTSTITVRFQTYYGLRVTRNDQCKIFEAVMPIWNEESADCNKKALFGSLFLDQNENCLYDSSEVTVGFPEIEVALVKDTLDTDLVLIENDHPIYNNGIKQSSWVSQYFANIYRIFFNIQKPYTFDYNFVKVSTNYPNSCSDNYIPIDTLITGDTTLASFDIPVQLEANCGLLEIDISTPLLRRCFESTYYVNYCNQSALVVEDVYIEVQLDEALSFAGSPLQAIALGNGLYRFDIGTLAEVECGQFPIQVKVDCNAELGQTHCTSATIFPIPDCLDWSGAELQVTAECELDSVLFTIENIGEEDMLTPSSYIAIEDVVMFSQGDFELRSQEKIQLRFPKNGSTYRLRTQQVNGLPYPSQPTVALEGCGTNGVGNFSRGFVTQFPEDDAAIFTSTHCEENRGAYDPNDKQVFPKGVGALGQIEQNVDLEYKIRFQNTGTDTAFTVIILDTLDARLDASSVQAGASSHPYIFEVIDGNVLRFQFNNILLPDSMTNPATSQGFVQFRVSQNMDVPLGETILNEAAIYFDFNEPIFTNQVSNQVGENFLQIIDTISNEPIAGFRVIVSPNPLEQVAIIEIEGQLLTNATFILYDFRGREVRQQRIRENKFHFYRKKLVSGGYFFKIVRHKDILHTGKLVVLD